MTKRLMNLSIECDFAFQVVWIQPIGINSVGFVQ